MLRATMQRGQATMLATIPVVLYETNRNYERQVSATGRELQTDTIVILRIHIETRVCLHHIFLHGFVVGNDDMVLHRGMDNNGSLAGSCRSASFPWLAKWRKS
jgi:hypothetical protein